MNTLNPGPLPESPQHEDIAVGTGAQRPMSQQDAADAHGHEMHLQKFVRLVGCHEENAGKHDAAHRLR
jgi:hypothetical protein